MKLFEINNTPISDKFMEKIIMLDEGKKADWVAANQGKQLLSKIESNNDKAMHGASAQEVAEYIEKVAGKYTPFYAKLYINGDVKKLEDLYKLKPLVMAFEKNKAHLENKDITSYTKATLEKAVEPYIGKMSHKHVNQVEDQKHYDKGHMTKHIDTPTFEVIVPHTQETSCHLGKGTDWCTAADEDHNMFDTYNDDGDLYVIRAGKRRFQLHYESDQFMNEKDEELSEKDIEYLSQFPQYKQFLDMMIKKHYFDKDVLQNDFRANQQSE